MEKNFLRSLAYQLMHKLQTPKRKEYHHSNSFLFYIRGQRVLNLMNLDSLIFFFRKTYDTHLKGIGKRGRIVSSHKLNTLDTL